MITLSDRIEKYLEPLTARQREVLELAVLEGLLHREIAVRLGIGRRTVANHMSAIYDKLCHHRRGLFLAAVEAHRRGELSLFMRERKDDE